MDWLTMIEGIVAILAVTARGLYANESRYRSAARSRARRLKKQEERASPTPPVPGKD